MIRKNLSLDVIDVKSPCSASWDDMRGDERARFCGDCKLHVYNLSEMTRSAAEALVMKHEGRLCVRFYRRADGTMITRDCSRIRAAARRTKKFAVAMLSAAMCAMLAPFGFARTEPPAHTMGRVAAPATALTGTPAVEPMQPTMGVMAPPTQPSTQPSTQPATQPSTQPSGPTMGEIEAPKPSPSR